MRYLLIPGNLGATATAAGAIVMCRRVLFASQAVLLLTLLVAFHACGQDFQAPPGEFSMPFELRAGFLVVVGGQIENLRGLKFILDTGSSYTMIDTRVADRFGLPRRPGKITSFDRDMAVEWADLPELRIGLLQVGGVPVLVAKLSDYSDFTEGVDGIIGLDLLGRSKRLFINYERQMVFWEFADGLSGRDAVPACFAVPLVVRGVRLELVLDTGLRGILIYRDRLQKSLPQLQTEKEILKVNFGRVQTTAQKLTGVRLGPKTVATVFLMDRPASGDPPGVDGYLGIASLNAKRVEFDFSTNTFRWQ